MPHERGTVLLWVCGLDGKTVDRARRASELPVTSAALSDDLISLHGRIARGFPAGVGEAHHHEPGVNPGAVATRCGEAEALPDEDGRA